MRRAAGIILVAVIALLMVGGSTNAAQADTPKSLPLPLISANFFYSRPEIFWSADGQQFYVEYPEDQGELDPRYYAYSVITRDLTLKKSGHDAHRPAVTDAERAEYDMEYVYSGDMTQRYVVYVNDGIIRDHHSRRRMWVLDRETGTAHPVINIERNWRTSESELGDIRGLSGGSVHLWGRNGAGFILRYTAAIGTPDPWWRWVSGYADDQADDGNRLAQAVQLFDLAISGQIITPQNVFDVSADSTHLLMGTLDAQLAVWYPDDPEASYIVPGISAETINNAAFHPANPGQIVAIGQNSLFRIESETGEVTMLHEGVVQERHHFAGGSAFSPNREWLAFQNQDREKRGIYLYNLLTNSFDSGHKPIRSMSTYTDSDTAVSHGLRALAWEGEWIAVGGEYGVNVYNADDLTAPPREIRSPNQISMVRIALDLNARVIVFADYDGGVWLWRDGNLKMVHKFNATVSSLALSPDGGQLAIAGSSARLQLSLFDLTQEDAPPLNLGKHYAIPPEAQVAFTPDSKLWIYTKSDPNSQIVQNRKLPFIWVMGGTYADFATFGTERYVEYVSPTLTTFDYERKVSVHQVSGDTQETYFPTANSAPFFAFNDRYVAFVMDQYSGNDRNIWLWDTLAEHVSVTILNLAGTAPGSLAFSPDGTRLASLTWDGMLHIWDLPHAQTEDASAGQ